MLEEQEGRTITKSNMGMNEQGKFVHLHTHT